MNSNSKPLMLTFTVLLLSSLLVISVTPVNVQAASKPSVPQFSVKIVTVNHEYFDGEIYVEKRIEVSIKNQPFTASPNTDTRGGDRNGISYVAPDKTSLYYQIQSKGHSDQDWPGIISDTFQSDSIYTVGSYPIYTADSQVDVRVRAVDGYYRKHGTPSGMPVGSELVVKAESDWSHPQTININNGYSTSSSQTTAPPSDPSTTADNNQPQIPNQTQPPNFVLHYLVLPLVIGVLLASVVIAVVMVFLRRHLKTSTAQTLCK